MKTNAVFRIVLWSVVLVALVGILGSFIMDERYLRDHTPEETAIPLRLSTEPTMATPVQPLFNEEELRMDPDTIRDIEIEWVSGDIIVMVTDTTEIRIYESDVTDDKYSLFYHTKGDKLELTFCEESLMSGFGIHFTPEFSKDLYIEVPRDWKGHSLEIDAASANVELHNIALNELDLDGASGTCDFQNCTIGDLDVDTASGDVYFSGTLNALDFDAASASFIGDLQNTPSRIDMDSMNGKLDIALPEDCGFTLTTDGMSIQLASDFNYTSTKNGSHVYGDGRCRIDVDGMNCDITIRKLNTSPAPAAETIPATVDPTAETVSPYTDPNCTTPDCPEHHDADNCADPNCPEHHTAANCTDTSCTLHHSTDSEHHGEHDGHH